MLFIWKNEKIKNKIVSTRSGIELRPPDEQASILPLGYRNQLMKYLETVKGRENPSWVEQIREAIKCSAKSGDR